MKESTRATAALLHEFVFFFDWRVQPEESRGQFQKKKMQQSRGNRKP